MSFSTNSQFEPTQNANVLPPSVIGSFEFEYAAGGVTPISPGTTGMRTVPQAVVVNVRGTDVRVTDATGKTHDVPDGAGFYLLAGQRHEIAVVGKCGVSLWSHVTMRILGSVDFLALFEARMPLPVQYGSLIGDLNAKLAASSQDFPDVACRLEMEGHGRLLAAALTRDAALRPLAGRLVANVHRLRPVLEYVADNVSSATIDAMAEVACLSTSRFHSVFRDLIGVSPGAYLQSLRMRKAQQLLLTTDLPIGEVARLSGHADPFHFSRLFRKLFALSPSEYRASIRASMLGG